MKRSHRKVFVIISALALAFSAEWQVAKFAYKPDTPTWQYSSVSDDRARDGHVLPTIRELTREDLNRCHSFLNDKRFPAADKEYVNDRPHGEILLTAPISTNYTDTELRACGQELDKITGFDFEEMHFSQTAIKPR